MTSLPPKTHTYHCICTSLLLASTHTLSTLPKRTTTTGGLDNALILPLPPPSDPESEQDVGQEMPEEGYTLLLGMNQDKNVTIIRREDGFEKRHLWRCIRCRLVVGYELPSSLPGPGDAMDIDGGDTNGKGKGKEGGEYEGKVIYLLPGGITSTDVMAGGRKIAEEDLAVKVGGIGVFE